MLEIYSSREQRFVPMHVSASQLGTYFGCGMQWKFRYVDGLIIPPGVAAYIGKGVHSAAEVNFTQKIKTEEDLPLDDLKDAARDGYLLPMRDEGLYLTHDELAAKASIIDDGLDKALQLTELLHGRFAPNIFPTAVERELRWTDPEIRVEWLGYADLQEEETLHDIKSTGKTWSQMDADRSDQLTLYDWMVEEIDGAAPAQLELDIFKRLKASVNYYPLYTERTAADRIALQRKAKKMVEMVDKGIALPADPGSWRCSERWCGYWSTCPYISDRLRRLPNR
jgi:hypothetical protein